MSSILPHNNAEVGASKWRFPREPDILSIHLIQDIVQSNLVRHLTVLEHVHEAHAGAREPRTILPYKNQISNDIDIIEQRMFEEKLLLAGKSVHACKC